MGVHKASCALFGFALIWQGSQLSRIALETRILHCSVNRYEEQRNKVVNELRRSKSHFFRSFNPSNPKQFWKIAKLLSKNSSSIPSLVKNGYTATTDSDKATMLNGFFSECFNTALPPSSINQEELQF